MSGNHGLMGGGKYNDTRDGPRPVTIFEGTDVDVEREHRDLLMFVVFRREDHVHSTNAASTP